MSYRFIQIKQTLLSVLIAGVLITGCSDHTAEQSGEAVEGQEAASTSTQEKIQVGTDLDLEQLKRISAAYYEQEGAEIEWVPMSADVFKIEDADALQLSQDVELSPEIDMLLMHSAYTLANASHAHKLQPVGSEVLIKSVPTQYQDPQGYWYGLGKYARTLVYNQEKVNEPELINYAGVGGQKWLGRLCMTDIYTPENQAIAKMMWTYRGTKLTPEILGNWQRNMGQPSVSNLEVLSRIEQGYCDVGIVDSDVFWGYALANPQTSIRLMWANQINRGALTNAISAGLTDEGEQVGEALRFMEWLVSDTGQAILAFNTHTFPVVDITDPTINMQVLRPSWTQFEADATALSDIIANRRKVEPLQPEPTVEPSLNDQSDTTETP